MRRRFGLTLEDAAGRLYVSARRRCLFVAVPDPALAPIVDMLRRADPDLTQGAEDFRAAARLAADPDALVFCFVRNPYLRAMQTYLELLSDDVPDMRRHWAPRLGLPAEDRMTFGAFLQAVHRQSDAARPPEWRTQAALLQPRRSRYDFIGRYDAFSEDLRRVAQWMGALSHADLTPVIPPARAALARYMGPRQIQRIQRVYRADFRAFGISPGVKIL